MQSQSYYLYYSHSYFGMNKLLMNKFLSDYKKKVIYRQHFIYALIDWEDTRKNEIKLNSTE